jgi:hypothetical protein
MHLGDAGFVCVFGQERLVEDSMEFLARLKKTQVCKKLLNCADRRLKPNYLTNLRYPGYLMQKKKKKRL